MKHSCVLGSHPGCYEHAEGVIREFGGNWKDESGLIARVDGQAFVTLTEEADMAR